MTTSLPEADPPAPAATKIYEPKWLSIGLSIAVWTLSIVVTAMAANGQLGFADWADIHGITRFGVPAIGELLMIVLLLLGYQRGLALYSPWPLWGLACGVGAFAVYTNVVHAGPRAGLVFGAASAATLLLWLIKLWLKLSAALVAAGKASGGRPKLGVLWFVAPRLAARAWLTAVRLGLDDLDTVRAHAEVWIAMVDDVRAALKEQGTGWFKRRRLAKRTAWRAVYVAAGRPVAALPATAHIASVALVDAPPEPARDELDAPAPEDTPRPTPPVRRVGRAPRASRGPVNSEAFYAQYARTLDREGRELTAKEIADALLLRHEGSARKVRAKLRHRYATDVVRGARVPSVDLPGDVQTVVVVMRAKRELSDPMRAIEESAA